VAFAINNRGQVAGVVRGPGPDDGQRAFFTGPNQRIESHMGTFTRGSRSDAWAINTSGQVVGSSSIAPSPSDPSTEALAFRTSSSRPMTDDDSIGTLSTAPPRRNTLAFGINDRGQVVGVSGNNAGRYEAFRTAPGAPINPATDGLGTLGGTSIARAINIHGQVVGESELLGGPSATHAFRTAPGGRIDPLTDDLGTLGGAISFATDINDLGVVVGSSTAVPDPPGSSAPFRAFVYFDGEGIFDLNALIANPIPDGWTLMLAEGINSNGQIVGRAEVRTQHGRFSRAFLLTPVPEPSLAAVPLAALLLAARPARRRNAPRRAAVTSRGGIHVSAER
jgi:probable HAF family extracellular repeat protein